MRKSISLILFCLILLFSSAFAEVPEQLMRAADSLRAMEIDIPESVVEKVAESEANFFRMSETFGFEAHELSVGDMIYDLLICAGMGGTGPDGSFEPITGSVYAFEVVDVDPDQMYRDFFHGMRAIVTDLDISDFTKSSADNSTVIVISVNDHPYTCPVDMGESRFDYSFLAFFRDVLARENAEFALHDLNTGFDSVCLLFYGSNARAGALKLLIEHA